MKDEQWLEKVYETTAEKEMIGSLEGVHVQFKKMAEPLEEEDQPQRYRGLYQQHNFIDDTSGGVLDRELAIRAWKLAIDVFKRLGVHIQVRKQKEQKVISTKWIDTNQRDAAQPNYRSRLAGREIKGTDKRDDLFVATSPLESL